MEVTRMKCVSLLQYKLYQTFCSSNLLSASGYFTSHQF